jgi:hypothetical protein
MLMKIGTYAAIAVNQKKQHQRLGKAVVPLVNTIISFVGRQATTIILVEIVMPKYS